MNDLNKRKLQFLPSGKNGIIEVILNSQAKYKSTKIIQKIYTDIQNAYYLLSKDNFKMGLISEQPNIKKNLITLLKGNSNSNQKILITKVYIEKIQPKVDNNHQQLKANLRAGFNLDNKKNQCVCVVYYKNKFYRLDHYKLNQMKNGQNLKISKTQINNQFGIFKHKTILVQPKGNVNNIKDNKKEVKQYPCFQALKYKVSSFDKDYKENAIQMKRQHKWKDDAIKVKQASQFDYQLKNKIYELVQHWHQDSADCRLSLVNSMQKDSYLKCQNYYFYHQFQQATIKNDYFQCKINLKEFKIKPQLQNKLKLDQVRLLKQLILQSIISYRYKNLTLPLIQNIHQKISLNVKDYYLKQIRQKKEEIIKSDNELACNRAFPIYNQNTMKQLISKWKNKMLSKRQNYYVLIQMGDMHLDQKYKYMGVTGIIDLKTKQASYQNQTQQFLKNSRGPVIKDYQFQFDDDLQDCKVKLIPKKDQAKTICFPITEKTTLIMFRFDFKINDKKNNKTTNYSRQISVANVSSHKTLGQKYQLVLKDQSSNHVGDVDVFMMIKKHYNIHFLQKLDIKYIRKSYALKKMGYLPKTYYEQIEFNYTPNQMQFYNHMFNPSKTSTIQKENLSTSYICLIQYLQKSRIQHRRQKQMIKTETFRQRSSYRLSQNDKKRLQQQNFRQSKHLQSTKIQSSQQKFQSLKYKQQPQTGQLSQFSLIANSYQFSIQQRVKKYSQLLNFAQLINRNLPQTDNPDQIFTQCKQILYVLKNQSLYQHQQTKDVCRIVMNTINNINNTNSIIRNKTGNKNNNSINSQNNNTNNINKNQIYLNPYIGLIINRVITILKMTQLNKQNNINSKRPSSVIIAQNVRISSSKQAAHFCVQFLTKLYPYFKAEQLQKDLSYIRYFVKKHLSTLNYTLNRKKIGLQKLVSKYLVSFFSYNLQQQLTFQIWDFIVLSPNLYFARLTVILTLLIFLEKTNLQPIIPQFIFIKCLYQNYKKFDFSQSLDIVTNSIMNITKQLFQKQQKRKHKIINIKNSKGKLIPNKQFIYKIVFNSQRIYTTMNNNKNNLNLLPYKLPVQKYYGHRVQSIKLFIRSFCIFDTVSMLKCCLVVKWHNIQSCKINLCSKRQYLNQFLVLPYPQHLIQKGQIHNLPAIQFVIYSQQPSNTILFIGKLCIQNLHKNTIYSENIRLILFKSFIPQLTTKGQNTLNIQLILKSSLNTQSHRTQVVNQLSLERQYYQNQHDKLQLMYDTILDYDISQTTNDGIKELKHLTHVFNKIMNPVDQFNYQKQTQLNIPGINQTTFPQVVMNSQMLIQHFHTLIYQTFGKQQQVKQSMSQLYKTFSCSTNYQLVFLSQVLLQCILVNAQISLSQRIDLIYCIGRHYQNTCGKGLTQSTIDYIFQYIHKLYGYVNAVTYIYEGKGQIISAIIYQGAQFKEKGLDMTAIMQDWAHICKVKHGYYGLILGTYQYLNVLQRLIPIQTLQKLSANKYCTVEIVYKKSSSQYVWAAQFQTREFKISHMGTKFLNQYPSKKQFHSGKIINHEAKCSQKRQFNYKMGCYCKINDVGLDASSEILLNYNCFISLQQSKSFTKQQFKRLIYSNPLLCYLLNYTSLYQPLTQTSEKTSLPLIRNEPNESMHFNMNNQHMIDINNQEIKDWVLYRYQDCISQWKKCQFIGASTKENVGLNQIKMFDVKFKSTQTQLQTQIIQIAEKYKQTMQQIKRQKITQIVYIAPQFQVMAMQQIQFN